MQKKASEQPPHLRHDSGRRFKNTPAFASDPSPRQPRTTVLRTWSNSRNVGALLWCMLVNGAGLVSPVTQSLSKHVATSNTCFMTLLMSCQLSFQVTMNRELASKMHFEMCVMFAGFLLSCGVEAHPTVGAPQGVFRTKRLASSCERAPQSPCKTPSAHTCSTKLEACSRMMAPDAPHSQAFR